MIRVSPLVPWGLYGDPWVSAGDEGCCGCRGLLVHPAITAGSPHPAGTSCWWAQLRAGGSAPPLRALLRPAARMAFELRGLLL